MDVDASPGSPSDGGIHATAIPCSDTCGGVSPKMVRYPHMAVCQNLVPLVNIKIAGKWMFIPLKMVFLGIDPYPYIKLLVEPPVYHH